MRKSIIGAVATFALTTSTLIAPAALATPAQPTPGEVVGAPAAVAPSATPRLAKWQELQYGLFMHWGVYSAFGGSYNGRVQSIGYPEQIKAWMNISDEAYLAEAAKMDASKWDAAAVCQTAKDAGMKYVMITSKHHDGFAMWDTKTTDYNIVKKTAFGRDPMKELQTECNSRGIKLAFYYSIIDWTKQTPEPYSNLNPVNSELMDLMHSQITELLSNYGPIAEFWFDMGKPTATQSEQLAAWVHELQPDTVVNSRVWNSKGDFEVGGDNAVSSNFSYGPWESIKSIFPSCWGYCSDGRANRTTGHEKYVARAAIKDLVTVISGGGQFAYNVGPKGDGSFDPYDAEVLKQMSDWMKRHPDAISGAKATYFPIQRDMRVTTKGNSLFLFPAAWTPGQQLTLPGLANAVTKVTVDGSDRELAFSRNGFDLTVTLDGEGPDELKNVIRVDLDGPAGMYTDKTVALTNGVGTIPADKVTGLRGTNTWGNGTALDSYVVDNGDTEYKDVTLKFDFNMRPTPRAKYKITFGDTTFVVTGSQLMAGPVGEGLTLNPKTVTRLRVELAEPRYYTDNVDFSINSVKVEASTDPGAEVAPTILEQPMDQSVVKGSAATFTVGVHGRPLPSYQWYKKAPGASEAVVIANAKEASYTLESAALEDSGTVFTVVVTNDLGSVTSQEATLQVTSPVKNLALRKPTSQSSTGWGGVSSRAVDGNTDGLWDHDSVTHTLEARGNWWQVDLEDTYSIGKVNVWNRAAEHTCRPSCEHRLSDFYVIAAPRDLGTKVDIEALQQDNDVKVIKVDGVGKYPSVIDFEGFEGRYVRIFLPAYNPLSLSEVEVIEAEKPAVAPEVSAIEVSSLLDEFQMAGDGQFRTVTTQEGSTLEFSASVTAGDPAPELQWQSRVDLDSAWEDIAEETESTLTLALITEDTGTQYRLKATNEAGVAYSGVVEVRVNAPEDPAPEPGDDSQSATPDPQPAPDTPQSVPVDPSGDQPQSSDPGDTPESTPGDDNAAGGDSGEGTPGNGGDNSGNTGGTEDPGTPLPPGTGNTGTTPAPGGEDPTTDPQSPQSGGIEVTPMGAALSLDTQASVMVQGGKLVVDASGFMPNGQVTFTIHSEPTLMGTFTTDPDGKVSVTWPIPADFEAGTHTVFATQGETVAKLPVEISAAKANIPTPGKSLAPHSGAAKVGNSGAKLASTGGATDTLALVGILAVGAGVALRGMRRRHRE